MDDDNDIAIVGVGCRFPGANNADEFWRVLVNGENHVNEINNDRWNHDAFYSDNKDDVGKYYVKRAGLLKNHDEWDHRLFGVSESEAVRIDPQQRYVLECTHMAMEDGGITRADLKDSLTGVFIGVMNDDYKSLCDRDGDDVTNYSATGQSTTIIASRVSYTYDLRGPCLVIDTACSSAMTAIHLGSQALKTGDCTMAICGGVSSIISPAPFIALCKARMMSEVGQCQTFCDSADGYARGEGCGIVMLKTVKRATEDRNKIWAILRTGCNQDGHAATPITAPSGEQQELLLRHVYSKNDIDPLTLQYIEMHGTGTPIGDPTEVNALGAFINSYKHTGSKTNTYLNKNNDTKLTHVSAMQKKEVVVEGKHVIKIGSVKTNIGHTESAAGAASLIKVLLMMKNGKLVPSLHIKKDKSNLNKKINLDGYDFEVVTDTENWKANENGERIACVNSFGFGGSNGHSIVIQKNILPTNRGKEIQICPYHVFCISAMDRIAFKNTIEQFGEEIRMNDISISDVAHTCAFRRDHYSNRTLIYGQTLDEISEQVKIKVRNIDALKTQSKTRLVFVFCGVGTTWNGMCSEMLRTQPVFRAKIQEIDTHLEPLSGWCIADKFKSSNTDYSNPFLNHIAIFCTQVALFAVWENWGALPDVIVGQSVGEVAAAVASQSLSLKDGVSVIYHRSKYLADRTGGKMMVAGNLKVDRIESLCRKHDKKVVIAVYNSPISCTLSGDGEVMDKIKDELEKMNANNVSEILIRPLSVQCAYHSHHVEPCMARIESQLNNIAKGARTIDHISTVTGKIAEANEFQTGKYWADNIRKPVRFMQALIGASVESATNVFIEIGPRQVLKAHLPNIMQNTLKGVCLPSMNAKKENMCMYNSLSELYEMGVSLKLNNIVPTTGSVEAIPRYCFNKAKILHMPEKARQFMNGEKNVANTHMFVRPNSKKGAEFRIEIDRQTTPFVFDHYMQTIVLVPGATYIEAAFEIGQNINKNRAYDLTVSVEFVNPLTITDDKRHLIEVDVTDMGNSSYSYRGFQDQRTLFHGTIIEQTLTERKSIDLEAVRDRCQEYISKEDTYMYLQKIGLKYGESLRLIETSWASPTECVVEMIVPDCIKAQTKLTCIHPSIIDGMFQTSIIVERGGVALTLPKGTRAVVLYRPTQDHMFCYSKLMKKTPTGNHYNCLLVSPQGDVLAEIQDLYTKTVQVSESVKSSSVYELTWNKLQVDWSDRRRNDDDGTEHSGKIIVFGTSRFLYMFTALKNQSNVEVYNLDLAVSQMEAVYQNALSQNGKPQAIVFAACHNVENVQESNSSIYDLSKNMFLCLSLLIQTARGNNYNVPIYVITENVIACPKLNIRALNICGSELWGMVRSVISEAVYPDIRLLDMSLAAENINLIDILRRPDISMSKEYLLHEGRLYTSEFIESPDQDHDTKQLKVEKSPADTITLKSAHPMKISDPHFQLNFNVNVGGKDGTALHTKVRLVSIVQHDISIYQITLESAETHQTIWPENEGKGFQVIALEGSGFLENRRHNGQSKNTKHTNGQVGFCYPVNVSSVVSVPPQCVFDMSELPVYIPGMMITSFVLWNIAEVCKQSMNVLLVVDDDTSALSLMSEQILSMRKKTRVVKISKRHLDLVKAEAKHSYAYTAVLLTMIDTTQLNTLQKDIQHLERIVSVEQFVTKSMRRWILYNMKETQIHIFNMDDLFTDAKLVKIFPKIQNWMKSPNTLLEMLEIQLKMQTESITRVEKSNPLTLPQETLVLDKDQPNYEHIPLKVHKTEVFRTNGCYILVGGLTGLGWELLQLMAELGAGYLVTLSRRPPSDDKQTEINDIQTKCGCKIICVQVDITNLKQLDIAMKTLQSQIGDSYIKGIFHGGGVVNDKLLISMTDADVEKPLQPKINGTWNLHSVTKDMPLDFFVMHSSIVSLLGNSGQSSYAAGNSFQDSFAHYRRGKGLCGQSINWSALSVGMATQNKALENMLRNQGFIFLSREDIRSCFITAIMTNKEQVSFGIFDWNRMSNLSALKSNPQKFSGLLGKFGNMKQDKIMDNSKSSFNMGVFNTANAHMQTEMIQTLIKVMVTEILVVEKESLNVDTRFVALGIDSMAAMSFTNSIFESTHIRIPVVMLLSDTTTIGSLTTYILDNIGEIATQDNSLDSSDSPHIDEYLDGNVTFMQKEFLRDYLKNPHNGQLMKQADFELKGVTLRSKDWRTVINHLLNMNPELHRVYTFNENGTAFDSQQVPLHDVDIDLKEVPFDSICTENSQDTRDDIFFDLTKDLPIKFQISYRGDITRIRMYIQGVVVDMRSIAMLFRDFAKYITAYINGEPLPDKATKDLLPAEQVRKALLPKMSTMRRFWKQHMARDIQPFTFAKDFEVPLNQCKRYDMRQTIPPTLAVSIIQHLEKTSISLYNFAITAYILLLHEKTGKQLIPIYSRVDMSGHVPQLATIVTRATNTIPVIGDVRNLGTVKDYMKRSSDRLLEMTEQGGFPYELIEKEMQSELLQKHIGRHSFIMHNRTTLRQILKHRDIAIKLMNFYYNAFVYNIETTMFVIHDLPKNKIELKLNYTTACLGHEEAAEITRRLMELMKDLVELESAPVTDLLRRTTDTIAVSKSDLENTSSINPEEIHKAVVTKDTTNKNKNFTNKAVGAISTVPYSNNNIIVREDTFQKQTSQGWDHKVHVVMTKDITNGQLLLCWGKEKNSMHKSVRLDLVREAHVKRINALYGILIKLPNRMIVLKTWSRVHATDWLNAFKSEIENYTAGNSLRL